MIQSPGEWLIENNVHPDITRAFVTHSDLGPSMRTTLFSLIEIVGNAMPGADTLDGIKEPKKGISSCVNDAESAIQKTLGSEFASHPYWSDMIAALYQYPTGTIEHIRQKLMFLDKNELTTYQRAALSNLSNGGIDHYLNVCGTNFTALPGFSKVLDIGAGKECKFATELEQERPDISVTSTSAHRAGMKVGPDHIFTQAIIPNLPFIDDTFDCVTSVNAWPYYSTLDNLGSGLTEISRVLKPGGFAVLAAAITEYGAMEITQGDLALHGDPNISLTPLTDRARSMYTGAVQSLIRIEKPL